MTRSNQDPAFDIWPPYEAFYIEAMLFSTKTAIASIEAANEVLDTCEHWAHDPERKAVARDLILDNVQVVIASGAALSRYFWPARRDEVHLRRARRLRESLDVQESSPLRSREVRNLIEHFDERLDQYLAAGISGRVLPVYIGNRPETPEVPVHLFRAYYTEVAIFEVLGERFEVKPIVEEIARLHHRLQVCRENGSRLPDRAVSAEP